MWQQQNRPKRTNCSPHGATTLFCNTTLKTFVCPKDASCLHFANFCVPSLWNACFFCSLIALWGGARFSSWFLGCERFGGNVVKFLLSAHLLLLFPHLLLLWPHINPTLPFFCCFLLSFCSLFFLCVCFFLFHVLLLRLQKG